MQHSAAEKKYKGSLDCAVKLFKEGGIRSVYRGTMLTFMRGDQRIDLHKNQ